MKNNFFQTITLLDFLDVFVIAVFLYYFFILIQGTRAIQILKGVGVLLVFMLLSRYLGLQTVYWVMQFLLYGIAVALPIVFQPELRRALGYIGRGGGIREILSAVSGGTISSIQAIDTIVWAVEQLAESRIGALIVMERQTGLEEYIETGTILDADISAKLLLSVFNTKSPLHDGALIVRNFRIIAASCYLPLSENVVKTRSKGYGTRHRAALGLSEQTDAVIIVVSEETGNVSIARNGKITRSSNLDSLKKFLMNIWHPEKKTTVRSENFLSKGANIAITDVFKKKSGS